MMFMFSQTLCKVTIFFDFQKNFKKNIFDTCEWYKWCLLKVNKFWFVWLKDFKGYPFEIWFKKKNLHNSFKKVLWIHTQMA